MDVTYLNVDEFGKISLEELENAICPETVLISVMFANNERYDSAYRRNCEIAKSTVFCSTQMRYRLLVMCLLM